MSEAINEKLEIARTQLETARKKVKEATEKFLIACQVVEHARHDMLKARIEEEVAYGFISMLSPSH